MPTTGTYTAKFSFSFEQKVNSATTWDVAICKNGTSNIIIQTQRSLSSSNKDLGNTSGACNVSLAANDVITLYVRPSIINNIQTWKTQVTLVELKNESTAYCGGMVITSEQSAQSLSSSFAPLSGFTNIAETTEYWSFAANTLTAQSTAGAAGDYLVTFAVSFKGDGSNPQLYTIGISDAGTTDRVTITRETDGADYGNVVGSGIISISNGDAIQLVAKSTKTSPTITILNSSIALYKLSGSTSSAYGGMKITASQSVTNPGAGTYAKVADFSDGNRRNWDFNSSTNDLNATTGTLSAGNYVVDYSASINSPSATSAENVTITVFVGGVLDSALVNLRQLADNADVGSMGGTGVITINSATTKVDLRVKSDKTNNIAFNKATLILRQISEGTHDGSLPVELIAFSGKSINTSVVLNWETASEIENLGFIIERRQPAEEWIEIASYKTDEGLRGQGSVTHNTSYSFSDQAVIPGQTYQYRLGDVDYSGKLKYHQEILVTVSAIEDTEHPQTFILRPAYPNPFNPATRIQYDLLIAANITVAIYNITGKHVTTLINQPQEPGFKKIAWDATDRTGNQVGTGIYFYRINAGYYFKTGKLILIK